MSIEIKIVAPNGNFSVITTRDQEPRFAGKINHISSTEAQPWIVANFLADGTIVGGRTMQNSLRASTIERGKKTGFPI